MTDATRAKISALAILFTATAAGAQNEAAPSPQAVEPAAPQAPALPPPSAPAPLGQGEPTIPSPPPPSPPQLLPSPPPAGASWVGLAPSPGLLPAITIGQWQTRIYGFGEF